MDDSRTRSDYKIKRVFFSLSFIPTPTDKDFLVIKRRKKNV